MTDAPDAIALKLSALSQADRLFVSALVDRLAGAASAPAQATRDVDPNDPNWVARQRVRGVSISTVDRWIAANPDKIGRSGGRVYVWMPAFNVRGRPGSK